MALFYTGSGGKLTAGGSATGVIHGNWTLLKWQAITALFVICFSGIGTFILLKLVGFLIPLRMSEKNMEIGDVAEHGHEVYPSDVPSLGYTGGVPEMTRGARANARNRVGATPTRQRALRGRSSDRPRCGWWARRVLARQVPARRRAA